MKKRTGSIRPPSRFAEGKGGSAAHHYCGKTLGASLGVGAGTVSAGIGGGGVCPTLPTTGPAS